jgi:WD40 repeat protein
MRDSEAFELIARGLPSPTTQRRELMALAARLGEWPLLLKLVNGFLRDRVIRLRQSLPSAIAAADERLDEKGFTAFDARNETERTKAVALTIGVSLELLDGPGRNHFSELGIFADDAHVPIGIVEHLWRDHLDEIETENLLSEFYGLSLLLGLDLDRRTLQVHDTIRHFLRAQTGTEGLVAQQRRLLQALDEIRAPDQDSSSRHYYYLHLPYHLAEANERQKLDSLLLDPSWLDAKLAATANTAALVADYDHYALGETQQLIGRTLRLTAGICARDRRQLIPQLLGRLMTSDIVIATGFLDAARQCLRQPAILTEHPSLTPPGAEAARLEGRSGLVTALCVLPDGRLASGSEDGTIRLWDVVRFAEVARLEGHAGWVRALCVLPDGHLASASDDRTIRLWDVARGTEAARLEGHSDPVTALCVLPDGGLASASNDGTIRRWDVARGAEAARFEWHSDERHFDWVNALCGLPDGRLASGSSDSMIRLWDVARGAEAAAICCYSGRACCGSDSAPICRNRSMHP